MAQDRDPMATFDLVLRGEVPPEQRLDAQHREELPGHTVASRVGRLSALVFQSEGEVRYVGQTIERVLHPPPVEVGLRRRRAAAEGRGFGGVVLEDDRQPVVFVKRESAKDDCVHYREDRRSGTDPERQYRQRDGRERRRFAKGTKRGFQVVTHGWLDVRGVGPVGRTT